MPEVTIEIDGLAPGGDAVGRQRDPPDAIGPHDGRATFVPLAAPGERVRARIDRDKGRVAWAELVAIECASPDRVPPPCALFGACGGCQWQHVSIDAQRAAKKSIVERALATSIAPVVAARGRGDAARATAAAAAAAEAVPEPAEAEELVPLEEADAEENTGKVKAVVPESEDDIEIDETIEDDDDDDSTFIADEEEGDEDVTDIIGDVGGDEET